MKKLNLILLISISIFYLSCKKNNNRNGMYIGVVMDMAGDCGSCKIKLLNNKTIKSRSGILIDSILYTETLSSDLNVIGKKLQFDIKDYPDDEPEIPVPCPTDKGRLFKIVLNASELNK